MTCRAIYDRFLELFPWYTGFVESYKANKVEKDSIVIRLMDRRVLIFSADKNKDSLSVMH